jgi:hypothetical protein
VWSPLAYGVPSFVLFISMHWIPPLYPTRRKDALWKWIAFSFGVGFVFALVGCFAPFK